MGNFWEFYFSSRGKRRSAICLANHRRVGIELEKKGKQGAGCVTGIMGLALLGFVGWIIYLIVTSFRSFWIIIAVASGIAILVAFTVGYGKHIKDIKEGHNKKKDEASQNAQQRTLETVGSATHTEEAAEAVIAEAAEAPSGTEIVARAAEDIEEMEKPDTKENKPKNSIPEEFNPAEKDVHKRIADELDEAPDEQEVVRRVKEYAEVLRLDESRKDAEYDFYDFVRAVSVICNSLPTIIPFDRLHLVVGSQTTGFILKDLKILGFISEKNIPRGVEVTFGYSDFPDEYAEYNLPWN